MCRGECSFDLLGQICAGHFFHESVVLLVLASGSFYLQIGSLLTDILCLTGSPTKTIDGFHERGRGRCQMLTTGNYPNPTYNPLNLLYTQPYCL